MTILTKDIKFSYIPGSPGVSGTAGSPYVEAYCVFQPGVTVNTAVNAGLVQVWVETEDNPYTGDQAGGYFVWVDAGESPGTGGSGSSYTYPGITTCYDAVPAVPAVAYEPPTASELVAYYNEGWNSHSRSVSSLDTNEIFYCTVSPGTVGAFIGIGKKGMDESTIGSFSHGVMVDSGGVYVYENGIKVATLSSSSIGSAQLRITRKTDNSIEYSIGTGAYASTADFSVASGIQAYVYAYLYSGGDSLLTAGLTVGEFEVLYGAATLTATSSITAKSTYAGALLEATSSLSAKPVYSGAVLAATSSLSADSSPVALLTATSSLFAYADSAIVSNTTLGALNGSSGESSFIYQPTVDLGALTTEVIEGSIVPSTPIRIIGSLSPLVGTGALTVAYPNYCAGDLNVPKPTINASFGIFGDLDVPAPTVSGTLFIPTVCSGDLDVPLAIVNGTFNTVSLFAGDIDVPLATIDGTIINGNILSGDLHLPKIIVCGTAPYLPDLEGDLSAPLPSVDGIISTAADDSVWSYTRGTTCQQ